MVAHPDVFLATVAVVDQGPLHLFVEALDLGKARERVLLQLQ